MYNAAAAATASVHLVIYLMGCVTVLLVRYTYSRYLPVLFSRAYTHASLRPRRLGGSTFARPADLSLSFVPRSFQGAYTVIVILIVDINLVAQVQCTVRPSSDR